MVGMRRSAESAAGTLYAGLSDVRRELAAADASTLATQMAIAHVPAPTGSEDRRAAFVADCFRAKGLAPDRDDAGNVIARLGDQAGAPVLVLSHLDTVFPADAPITIERSGARWIGPGVSDNARGLAAMLAIAGALRGTASRFRRRLEFVATAGEEGLGDLRGARHALDRSDRPHAVVALDGAGSDRIVTTGLGARRFRIAFNGPGGHSWSAGGVANAIHAATRLATGIADLRATAGNEMRLAVTRIGGGHAVNAVPEHAWLEVDLRSADEHTLVRVEREVREQAEAAARIENEARSGGPALALRIERIGARPAGRTAPDSNLVALAAAVTTLAGGKPELAAASTDANAAMAIGVPAVAIGAGGRAGDTHTTREWYENAGGSAGLARAMTLIASLALLDAD